MTDLVKLSKFLSLILRHKPKNFGLVMDSEGFTDLEVVWERICKRHGNRYSRDDLQQLLEEHPAGKQRFEAKDGRIRARYGHSVVEVQYPSVEPPEILYHGTTPQALQTIRKQGLTSQKRQFVHLSTSTKRATNVASRHGQPITLKIRALAAHNAGHIFHHPEPQHYLVKSLPPDFIVLDDV